MVGRGDVGFRVVVRRVIGLRDGRPLFTDILGDLVEYADEHMTIATRTGPVKVPVAAIVAGKRIPPAPVRQG